MSSEERQARSLALEKAYVHDVYDQIAPHFTDTRYRAWPRVKQFLLDLEPASMVADVGCGNGKYLDVNREAVMIGSDRCAALTAAAGAKNHQVVTCDNLELPFRDETFDAALSVAVIHHFATTDRRVCALKELARILRIGGKVLITVWAMEQRHRKFDSQDVLVPWHEPVKSSSEDRASSLEREVTSTTTSDDDVLVYHAYSHISDSEAGKQQQQQQQTTGVNRRRQKFRNGRGRYRSADHHNHHHHHHHQRSGNSRSSSELSSPNETCYSFVKRALQKLSSSTSSNAPYHSQDKPYFYRSCRRPWASGSMEFGPNFNGGLPYPDSSRNDFCHQSSIDSEFPDQQHQEDDVPIELRHLEGYEACSNCGSPVIEMDRRNHCENVCSSCLPIDTDSSGKKSRSLGDFFNMIPKLLRSKKCDKEPLSDLHKRISTASDPREYVVKSKGSQANGIVRSKSTVSFMSRLEEIMSFTASSEKNDLEQSSSDNVRNKKSSLVDSDRQISISETDRSTNPRRYNSPADALRKLRQDVSLDGSEADPKQNVTQQSADTPATNSAEDTSISKNTSAQKKGILVNDEKRRTSAMDDTPITTEETSTIEDQDDNNQDGHLSSYYSMPELYKFIEEQGQCETVYPTQRQRHISFYEQAQTVMGEVESTNKLRQIQASTRQCTVREGSGAVLVQRTLVKRSVSVDTGENSLSSHRCPRRFSASAAQGVLASALRTYSLPRSSSRGSSVKSDTSIDSEESIVSVIPRKGNSITSDTSVESEESVVSVIQRSTSEIETLVRESGLRNNISRLGSRSARASPITVLSSQTSSAESSPPQSGKNDGKFPGSGAVIDQLMQQQQQILAAENAHSRLESDHQQHRNRRQLLRPLSDSKADDRLGSSFDDSLLRSSSVRSAPMSNRSSLESDDRVIRQDNRSFSDKAVVAPRAKSESEQLSRTPSPIGPFTYIFDPLLNDACTALENIQNSMESAKETNDQPELGNCTPKCKQQELDTQTHVACDSLEASRKRESYGRSKASSLEMYQSAMAQVQVTGTSTEAERHEKLRKLSKRLENLGVSSELLKSFYASCEDLEENSESSDRCKAEAVGDAQRSDDSKSESCVSDNIHEKSDEDSCVDESLLTVIHDAPSLGTTGVAQGDISRGEDIDTSRSDSALTTTENRNKDMIEFNDGDVKPGETDPKADSRSSFRKRLKRSCVTIDEVECREVASSEDTSPSSSASLEWNDFDRAEVTEAECQAIGSNASRKSYQANNVHPREDDIVTSPEDVNVADTESKFNVFLDKEMCVFFETPPSSIGKSASSSSNATDFSTTSERIRGVMQREKSDDRSSKESDSDNISKLSDLEPKSESIEDPIHRTDLELQNVVANSSQNWCDPDGGPSCFPSSSSSKLWVLDNIDEMADIDDRPMKRRYGGKKARPPREKSEEEEKQRNQDSMQRVPELSRDAIRNNFHEMPPNVGLAACRMVNHEAEVAQARDLETSSKDSTDDSEVPTDILAAFVETISDLTSVFGELYPRHDGKFDDVSSDDSLEISTFERILTSRGTPTEEVEPNETPSEAANPQRSAMMENASSSSWPTTNHNASANGTAEIKCQNVEVLTNAADIPEDSPEVAQVSRFDGRRSYHQDGVVASEPPKRTARNSKKAIENLDLSRKPKTLNRSSQSVCIEKSRQDSVDDEDDEKSSKTRSAPCSPILKPRQRSVEEVLTTSKAELSRNSSLSQSTSQESLPGNETGGLMAYHRYYHVFRQGELDNLIENYVENLHIIASYYDHANWCVVAEKVQVWTI